MVLDKSEVSSVEANVEMLQFVKGCFGFFDPGTSDPDSLSLWFRSNVSGDAGTPVMHENLILWERVKEANLPDVNTLPDALLPKHRTWSGGLLFTLPEAQFSALKPYKHLNSNNGIAGFRSSDCRTTSQTDQNRSVEVEGPSPLEDDATEFIFDHKTDLSETLSHKGKIARGLRPTELGTNHCRKKK